MIRDAGLPDHLPVPGTLDIPANDKVRPDDNELARKFCNRGGVWEGRGSACSKPTR